MASENRIHVILFMNFLLLLSSLLWSGTGYAQCPSDDDWRKKLIALDSIQSHPEEKIEELHSMQSLYLQCYTAKDSLYAKIVHKLGAFYRENDIEKAISLTQEAIGINSSKLPGSQPSFLANSYFNLGLYFQQLLIPEEASKYFDSCIQVGIRYPEKSKVVLAAFEQNAYSYFETGDYQKSIDAASYGILKITTADSVKKASLLFQKIQAQLEINQLASTEKDLLKIAPLLTESNVPIAFQANALTVYAHFLIKKKNYKEAVNNYQKAFQLNLENKFLLNSANNMNDLGMLYAQELNDPNKAIIAFNKGLDILHGMDDALYSQSRLYINMGMAYSKLKDYRKALDYYQKGLTVLPIHFKDSLPQNNPTSFNLKLVTNDYFVSKLLAFKGESFLEWYKAEKNEDHLHFALDAFRAASRMVDQMRWKQHGQQSKLFWREETKEMYENAIETCYLLNDHENAFFFFEKSRAVLLNDKLNELGAKKYLPQEDLTKEQELRIKLSSLHQKLSSLVVNTPPYNDTRQQLFATQETIEKFIKNLETTYPVYYQYKYDTLNPTIYKIRDNLADEQSLIEYFNGDSVIYILAIMPDTTVFKRINFKNYSTSANKLLTLSSDKALLNQNYGRYRELAYKIYGSLFKPLSIHTKKVIISPDDHFIPFEILLTDPDNPTSFLLRDHAFSYTYSADFLIKNTHEQPPAVNSLLGVAPVTYHPSLQQQPLTGADFSLENIEFNFQSAKFLMKESATKKQFLENLPLYSIVHLYSHANADSIGTEPKIYFYDSVLNVSELQTLGSLPTQLIVLSACNTGIGKNIRGEGVFSLARGFAAAGIPTSITTLWQIDNKPTYQLTELFYKYLSQELPLDEALQKAKLDFLDNNDITYELPYYWAANILIGKTDKISNIGNPPTFSPYLVIVTVLFIFIIFGIYIIGENPFKSRMKL